MKSSNKKNLLFKKTLNKKTSDITIDCIGNKFGKKTKIRLGFQDMTTKTFIFLTSIVSITSLIFLDIDWKKISSGFLSLGNVFLNLLRFNFSNFEAILLAFAETVTVTILATIYGIFIGLIMAFLMAKNICPNKKLSTLLYAYNSFIRAVPTPVWVLLMVACLGFGPASGVMGLLFHASAFFARVFAQAFEEISVDTVEALKATGATKLTIFFAAILPAAFTSIVAWSAMRFEINFSESAILGMVGGGGIGYSIAASITGYNFGRAGLSILMVFTFAFTLELIFTEIKKRLKT